VWSKRRQGDTAATLLTNVQTVSYINRVFDSTAGGFVVWETAAPDLATGASYPGPGTYGVDTSDPCISSIRGKS